MKAYYAVLAATLATCSNLADAAVVTYSFAGAIIQANPSAQAFPSSLGGLAFGDRFSGTLTYESTSPVDSRLPQPNIAGATPYRLDAFDFSFTVNGVTFDSWGGIPAAYVWNDVLTSSGLNADALMFVNIGTHAMLPDGAQFSLVTPGLSTGTFATDALPVVSMPERFHIRMGSVSSVDDWFVGLLTPEGLQVAPVPVPAATWLFGSGLLGLVTVARHRRRSCELQ